MLNFNDRALASSFQEWDPELSFRLQNMVDEVSELVNEALGTTDAESGEDEPADSPTTGPEQSGVCSDVEAGVVAPSNLTFESAFPETDFSNAPWSTDPGQLYPLLSPVQDQPRSSGQEQFDPEGSDPLYCPFQFRVYFPPQTIPTECRQRLEHAAKPALNLPLPSMQVSSETSFTRRLIWKAMEVCLQCLTSKNTSPSGIESYFRLNFACNDRRIVTSLLHHLASRTTSENLEFQPSFDYHIGGAGLHFARRGIDVSSPMPAWASLAGPTGPFTNDGAEKIHYIGWTFQDILTDLEMEGEWYYANDVEEYLRHKGLQPDALSSVIEIRDNLEILPLENPQPPAQTPMEKSIGTMPLSAESADNLYSMGSMIRIDPQSSLLSNDQHQALDPPLEIVISFSGSTKTSPATRLATASTDASSLESINTMYVKKRVPFSIPAIIKKYLYVDHFVSCK